MKEQKNYRTLDLYVRFCEGKLINKYEEAEKFGVNCRSIQRDIDDIRAFFDERMVSGVDTREIIYDRTKKGYKLIGEEGSMLNNSEILAVCKILLGSRAFPKKELSGILNKIVNGCVPKPNMKMVSDLISNEKYHYVQLFNQSYIQDKLWDIGKNIEESNVIEIEYIRQGEADSKPIKRVVEPVAIIFSEYYFYLNAYIVEKNEIDNYKKLYRYPAIFRIDRIVKYKKTGEKFRQEYSNKFEEGEFRKRVQFMYPGELINICFKYTGKSVEAILDRLPTATVKQKTGDGYILQAEVYGKGVLMWLLGQGNNVEVLSPASAREEMKTMISQMYNKYL